VSGIAGYLCLRFIGLSFDHASSDEKKLFYFILLSKSVNI
jgi:hypothetical protein